MTRRDGACWFDSARPRSLQPASDTASAYLRYRHERGEGRYAYAEARASHNRQRFDLGPTAVAIGLYGFTFNSCAKLATCVRMYVPPTPTSPSALAATRAGAAGIGISAQRSDVSLSTSGTVRAAPAAGRRDTGFPARLHLVAGGRAEQLFPSIRNRGRTEQWQGWWGMQRELMPLAGGAAQLATGIDLRQERWTSHPDALLSQGDLALGLPQEQRHLARRSGGAYAELGLPLAWHTLRMDLAARWDRDGDYQAFCPAWRARAPRPSGPSCLPAGAAIVRPACSNSGVPGLLRCDRAAGLHALPDCAQSSGNRRCSVTVDVVENDALKAERSRAIPWPRPGRRPIRSRCHSPTTSQSNCNEILALQPADAVWNPGTGRTAT